MRKLIPLILAGFFMVALITSPCSDKLVYAQDAIEPIPSTVDIRPNTINLRRNGNFIMGIIKLPAEYSIEDIKLDSIEVTKINGEDVSPIPADWEFIDEVFTDNVIAKFPNKIFKETVQNKLAADITYPTMVAITVGGTLTDGVTQFEGTDEVRVIKPGKGIWKNKDKGGKGGGNGDDGDDDDTEEDEPEVE
jgi:hypothetical protein